MRAFKRDMLWLWENSRIGFALATFFLVSFAVIGAALVVDLVYHLGV